MKPFLYPLLAISMLLGIANAQKPGDSVTPEALGKLEWVQGKAPTEWEPGKLYVLECWATWCGPCIAAIPHVDALYDKYESKGLRVIGVNVWEDGKDKVAEFVKKKGDGMSYPVAYTGKGGVFETDWLTPAGVRGIPHAFLVKDGKVLAGLHPMKLTDKVVEGLLQEGESGFGVLDELKAAQKKDEAVGQALQAFSNASKANDAAAMTVAVKQLEEQNPQNMYLPMMKNDILVAEKNWEKLNGLLDADGSEKMSALGIASLGTRFSNMGDVPEDTVKKLIAAQESHPELSKAGPFPILNVSRLYWKIGDKEKALEKAKAALEIAKEKPNPMLGTAPFEKFVVAVEGDKMPSQEEVVGWIREQGQQQKSATPPAAAEKE